MKKIFTAKQIIMTCLLTGLATLFLPSFELHGQNPIIDKDSVNIVISRTDTSLVIDGILNEEVWNKATTYCISHMYYPIDKGIAYVPTKIKVLYNKDNLYFGVVSFGMKKKIVVQSLKRDDEINASNNDGITLVIDPLNTAKNGYFFRINASGAVTDGVVNQNGIYPSGNIYWNNKWYASTDITGDSISYEIAIPFNALKFNDRNRIWAINFLRNDVTRDQKYSWTSLPANKHELDLGFTGNLVFEEDFSEKKSRSIIIIPSIKTGFTKSEDTHNGDLKVGADAKIALNSSLNLDLSVYPDFSNVTVDQQYIDFYRFEYYQQEQRTFFLENNDMFTGFGTYDDFNTSSSENRVKPVYTRRIGNNKEGAIIYGARVSGGIGKNTRIGILDMQTERSRINSAQNYFIGSVQKGVLKRSAIKGLITNRNAVHEFDFSNNDYNRTAGLEFDYSSKDGKLTANAKLHSAFTPDRFSNNLFYGGEISYFKKKFKSQNYFEHVDKNYITDIGFIPRLYYYEPVLDTTLRFGYTRLSFRNELYQYLTNNLITVMGEFLRIQTYFNDCGRLNEVFAELGYWSVFANRMHIVIKPSYNAFDLLVPHDVLRNRNPVLSGRYENPTVYFFFESDARKKLKYNVSLDYGGFYHGTKFIFKGGTSYTLQPYATVDVVYTYAGIDLKNGSSKANYHLFSIKPEISFNTRLLWTNLVQYNSQTGNFNFNSILQWRYTSMSDFYVIVKDDAYLPFESKEFNLSFKLTYWFDR